MSAIREARTQETEQKTKLVAGITQLTNILQIQTWDVLIIGDGSGSGWNRATGWSSVLIDRYAGAAKAFWGGINTGTITIGELFPYLHAMIWYFSEDGPGKERLRYARTAQRALHVHIVTDNSSVANGGNRVHQRHSNLELWAAMDVVEQRGVVLNYHHWGRKELSLNVLADEVARQARLAIQHSYQAAVDALARRHPGLPPDATVYDFFLWEETAGSPASGGVPPAP